MLGLLSFIFVLGTAVLVHEMGHFIVAKKCGVMCHEFAIGMGPAIIKWRRGETLYSIRAIPIGGYVLMAGEEIEKNIIENGERIGLTLNSAGEVTEFHLISGGDVFGEIRSSDLVDKLSVTISTDNGDEIIYPVAKDAIYVDSKKNLRQHIAPRNRLLESKGKIQRFFIMSAGATMNFFLALVFTLLVGFILGDQVLTNELVTISEEGPADVAGLQVGDEIIYLNGHTITNGEELWQAIQSTSEGAVEVTYLRDGVEHQTALTPTLVERGGEYVLIIGIDMGSYFTYFTRSFTEAIGFAWAQFLAGFTTIIITIRMLSSGEAGVGDLSGPVGIGVMAGQFASQGFFPLLIFASLININVGLLNLMPLPALDGGRILFIAIETIIGKPVPSKIEGYVHTTGFFLFMALFVFTFFNDIMRLFSS